jgi:hypothetical protein
MTTTQEAFDAKFEGKLKELTPYLVMTAGGDEDLFQEGAIGVLLSMREEPEAYNKYYKKKARWNILTQARGIGKSVDIRKSYKRKNPIELVHYDAVPETADAELSQAILGDRKRLPLDEYVINKVDLEGFVESLSLQEAEYVRMKLVYEMFDWEVAKEVDMSVPMVKAIKKGLRGKIEDYFSV